MSPPEGTKLCCPYLEGATFLLEVSAPNRDACYLQALVTKTFSPFTISPVMKVKLNNVEPVEPGSLAVGFDIPSEVIFKVYDRRFSPSLRRWYQLAKPTPQSELEYARYIPPAKSKEDEDLEIPEAMVEHLVELTVTSYFESECAVYDRLSSLQGSDIPIFFGATRFIDSTSTHGVELHSVRGVLVEFIPGVNLEFAELEPADIDKLVSNCMRIYEKYTDMDVLTKDMRFENFIVKPDRSGVVMIDFAQCRLRGENEDFASWKKAKWREDEEGAIGYIAQQKWDWKFQHSMKWTVPADEDD